MTTPTRDWENQVTIHVVGNIQYYSTYAPITWRLLAFTEWNLKCHVIIVIKTDLWGFVVPMHSGLCEQYIKSLGLTPSGFDFLFRTCPRALGQQTPPELFLTPETTPTQDWKIRLHLLGQWWPPTRTAAETPGCRHTQISAHTVTNCLGNLHSVLDACIQVVSFKAAACCKAPQGNRDPWLACQQLGIGAFLYECRFCLSHGDAWVRVWYLGGECYASAYITEEGRWDSGSVMVWRMDGLEYTVMAGMDLSCWMAHSMSKVTRKRWSNLRSFPTPSVMGSFSRPMSSLSQSASHRTSR